MDKPSIAGQPSIEPTRLETTAGREAAAQIARAIETSDTRTHRLSQVIVDFAFFPRQGQLALAEAAIMWAFASMARHPQGADAESPFYSLVDAAYVFTQDAANTMNETARNQISVAAIAVQDYLLPESGPIFSDSIQTLQRLNEDASTRSLGDILLLAYELFLDHASLEHLRDLVMHCYRLSLDLELMANGIECDPVQAMLDVFGDATAVCASGKQGIREGTLVVEDGKVVALERGG